MIRCTGSCDPSIALQDRGAYNIWGVSARYRVTGTVSFGFGVNNLADKRLFREATAAMPVRRPTTGPRVLGPALRVLTARGRRSAAVARPGLALPTLR